MEWKTYVVDYIQKERKAETKAYFDEVKRRTKEKKEKESTSLPF